LTHLPDRPATLARLWAYLEDYGASTIPFGVVSIAVDTMASVRQADGGYAMKAAIYATGQTIASTLGPNDMIGRWSEDRFLAVLTGCTAPTLLRAAAMMKRLANLEGIPWWGDRLPITLSMGGTVVQMGDTPEALVSRADAALAASLLQHEDFVVVA
jgi:GGDEF domain-containing protein